MTKNLQKVNWKWDKFNFGNKNTKWFMDIVKERFEMYMPKEGKILEIGCGTGNILTHLAMNKKRECWGIDIDPNSEKLVKKFAKERKVKAKFKLGNGFDIPFKDNIFDAVYSEGVIEHFSTVETKKMVQEHFRLVKKGGVVVISVPNTYNIPLTIAKATLGKKYAHYPERSYTSRELCLLLKSVGGAVVAVDGFAWQQGFAHLRYLKKVLTLLKYLPEASFSPKVRSIIGHETMVIARKI